MVPGFRHDDVSIDPSTDICVRWMEAVAQPQRMEVESQLLMEALARRPLVPKLLWECQFLQLAQPQRQSVSCPTLQELHRNLHSEHHPRPAVVEQEPRLQVCPRQLTSLEEDPLAPSANRCDTSRVCHCARRPSMSQVQSSESPLQVSR